MKLSIVIVNYNVRYFLEQCLVSVKRAIEGIEAEVFVVDNASADGSVEMAQQRFPFVKTIANKNNVGFSVANNQAMQIATGEYVLLLNPDTVVAENTFAKCIAFMDAHANAGALGVRMIDGKGNFLPESKRGLPTPAVAFYKTFGLSALFPKSQTFGRYHLGYLSEHETHEVEILSGAYMFMRKSALDKVGLLDETFFMYGEDVDLSYRVIKGGYKNFYFPDTTIIHYKGESTKKGSLNYVKVFYNAMIIFARKHFSGNQSGLFSLLINFAIIFRGLLTLLAGLFASSYLFIVDALLSFTGIYFIKTYWEDMIKYHENYYPNEFLFIVVPTYILMWIVTAFLSGAYDKPFRISAIIRGILLGTIAIAVLYAFIPDEWRFSRAIILLGAGWTGFEMLLTRTVYQLIKHQSFSVPDMDDKRSLVVGKQDATRAEAILRVLGNTHEINFTADLTATRKTAAIHKNNEIVFCSADFTYAGIIQQITECGNRIDYKILNQGSDALIGSNSKDSAGDLYVAEKSYALFKPENLRSKRVFDFATALLMLPLLPVNVFVIKNFGNFISNWLSVLSGKKSWVGFSAGANLSKFPNAKAGILHPADSLKGLNLTKEDLLEAELNYARHYSVNDDVSLLVKNYSSLGK
ncbi:MAG TPA: glycosyltransferase [Chitinophagales bacterium]|nr:glycosyltransferase [Chitinophagales bacterium]